MVKLSPSILNADFLRLEKQLDILKKHNVEYLHIDVMDGHYVDNISFAFPILESIKDCGFKLDIHLMIDRPDKFVKRFCEYGDIITVHFNTASRLGIEEILEEIRQKGTKAGVTLNPDEDVELLNPHMGNFDLCLLMSVFPGYGGQKFMPEVLNKAQLLQEIKDDNGFMLEIDGGINFNNIETVIGKYDFDLIVMGSALMKGDLNENLNKIRRFI